MFQVKKYLFLSLRGNLATQIENLLTAYKNNQLNPPEKPVCDCQPVKDAFCA